MLVNGLEYPYARDVHNSIDATKSLGGLGGGGAPRCVLSDRPGHREKLPRMRGRSTCEVIRELVLEVHRHHTSSTGLKEQLFASAADAAGGPRDYRYFAVQRHLHPRTRADLG